MARYGHSGNAQDTTLVGGINSTAVAITIADGTGYPDGSDGKFWIAIEPDTPKEEHIRVLSRIGTSLSLASSADRGKDDTAPTDHDPNVAVRHIWSAEEADDVALQSATNTFTAINTFTQKPVFTGVNLEAQAGTVNTVSIGVVGGGAAIGVGTDASNFIGMVATNVFAWNVGAVRQVQVDIASSSTDSSVSVRADGAMKRLVLGAADSGGSGYRLVRVAN